MIARVYRTGKNTYAITIKKAEIQAYNIELDDLLDIEIKGKVGKWQRKTRSLAKPTTTTGEKVLPRFKTNTPYIKEGGQ